MGSPPLDAIANLGKVKSAAPGRSVLEGVGKRLSPLCHQRTTRYRAPVKKVGSARDARSFRPSMDRLKLEQLVRCELRGGETMPPRLAQEAP